jgi:DNA-binding NarL/FixJ family response regulator
MRVQGVVVDLGAGPHRDEKLPTQNSPWTRKMTALIAGIWDKITLCVDTGHAVIYHHRPETGRPHSLPHEHITRSSPDAAFNVWSPDGTFVYSLAADEVKTAGLPGDVPGLSMPAGDGAKVIRALHSYRPSVKILAVSGAKAEDEQLSEAQRLGADALLIKPLGVGELREAVARLLAGSSKTIWH